MAARKPKLQPATKEKACQVCGESYVYPEPGSVATRHFCGLCAGLGAVERKILTRMAKRIQKLERTLTQPTSDET
ncbi:MAG: hypothetical protein ACQCXQ_13230 [Verrucomicrobiales bacterium]|nr:hypothetical protein [Verrucomicrobiota bacterium JB025]